ncbi:MAG: hypothetical protein ACKV19_11460 [Verrucomicrobiales bacterium]
MKSTKSIVEAAVAETLDPVKRQAGIARLERLLPGLRLAMVLTLIAFGLSVVLCLGGWSKDGSMISMVFGGAILSIVTYSLSIRRLVHLRVEEERQSGPNVNGLP